jgi:hypothetical protein
MDHGHRVPQQIYLRSHLESIALAARSGGHARISFSGFQTSSSMPHGDHHAVFPMRAHGLWMTDRRFMHGSRLGSAVAQSLTPMSLATILGLSVCPCVVHGRSPSVARSVTYSTFYLSFHPPSKVPNLYLKSSLYLPVHDPSLFLSTESDHVDGSGRCHR